MRELKISAHTEFYVHKWALEHQELLRSGDDSCFDDIVFDLVDAYYKLEHQYRKLIDECYKLKKETIGD